MREFKRECYDRQYFTHMLELPNLYTIVHILNEIVTFIQQFATTE